jgi:hypothetical protein
MVIHAVVPGEEQQAWADAIRHFSIAGAPPFIGKHKADDSPP